MSPNADQEKDGSESGLIGHLLELRDRLLKIVLVLLLAFVPLAVLSEQLYHTLAAPLLGAMPGGGELIVTNPLSAFLTPLKLAFFVAALITLPNTLYQLWAFIAPGLYRHEQSMVMPLLVSSTLLFYAGMAFAYFIVFPLVFGFLAGITPEGVAFMPDIKSYQDFVFTLFFAFGVAFELPVALVLLTRAGIVDPYVLATKRPYVVLWVFVIAMMLTPPDAFSQTLLAIPMLVLFEIGLVVAKRIKPKEVDDAGMAEDARRAEREAALDEYDMDAAMAAAILESERNKRSASAAPEKKKKAARKKTGTRKVAKKKSGRKNT